MTPDEQHLLAVARAITERSPVDWADAEGRSEDGSLRETLRELRVIAEIAALHGSERQPDTLERWGPLTLLEHVGHGSFGDVYRALDMRLDREVALKLMRRSEPHGEPLGATVIEEARLLARVRHPNVVTIYGADRIDGRVGLWMEFVRGRTLEELLQARGGRLTANEVTTIGRDICSALAAVHGAGLLHRDIKAQNVVQEPGGRLVLMDFGTGREAGDEGEETLAGTPLYLAPEVLEGRPASVQSDIYSVGVLLFHLLTGAYPVAGGTVREIRDAHRRGTRAAVPSEVSPTLGAAVARALEPDPAGRYRLASHMAAALETPEAAVQGPRRHLSRVAAALVAMVLIAVCAWILAPSAWSRLTDQTGAETGGPQRICYGCADEGGSIDWSGRWMAVTDRSVFDPHNLVVRDRTRTTRGDTLIASGARASEPAFYPVLSSDARRIAFAFPHEGRTQLRVSANAPDSTPTIVVDRDDYLNITPAAWSTDDRSILATIERPDHSTAIVWIREADGFVRVVKDLGWRLLGVRGRPTLSQDGRYIAYSALATEPASAIGPPHAIDQHIYIMAADDDSGRERDVVQAGGINEFPIWSWDGTSIFFISDASGTWDLYRVPIRDAQSVGAPIPVWVDFGCRCIALHRVSSAGLLYYTKRPDVEERTYVVEMEPPGRRVSGSPVASQIFPGTLPAWSADGRSIATKTMSPEALREGRFRTPLSSDFETTVYSLNGAEPRLYSRRARRTPVVWLDRAGFLESIRDGRDVDSLHRVDVPSGVRRWLFDYDPSIFTRTMALFAQASQQNRELYVFREDSAGRPRRIVALDLSTGRMKRTIHELTTGDGASLKLSPDGRTLAIAGTDDLGTFLGRVDVSGANYLELYSVPRPGEVRPMLAWTSDSLGILFVLEEPPSVFDLPAPAPVGAESRGSRDVNVLSRQSVMYVDVNAERLPSPTGVAVEARGRLQEISLSRDGSRLAYGVATGARELWVLDLAAPSGARK